MISTKKNKIFSFSILISIIIIVILLISKIQYLSVELNTDLKVIYILIILLLILSISLFILNISLTYIKKKDDFEIKTSNIAEDKLNKKVITEAKDLQKDEIDFDYYTKKIIPAGSLKKDSKKYCDKVLSNIAKELDIVQGLFYIREKGSDDFSINGKYAYFGEKEPANFEIGITLPGQVAKNKKTLNLTHIPNNYLTILSGLGNSSPNNIIILPLIFENETIGIIELASFKVFDKITEKILNYLSDLFGKDLSKF